MKSKHYPDTVSSPDFSSLEKEIIKFWQENKVFERSVGERSKDNCFMFYDGPPFANGLPHYGHLLTGFIKDAFARYQTMLQKRVERRFGWDCHGLPAEMGAEKELGTSGRTEIEKFGIDKFNDHCRTSVMKFSSEWEKYVNRQARWVDFHNDYKTMDKSFMESVMWAFKQLYDKGLVYESVRVVPYSWACETPLSNFETRLDNAYREKVSKSVTVAFELLENPQQFKSVKRKCKLLAWTTTPWTLPSNLALAIGKDIKYCAVSVHPLMSFQRVTLESISGSQCLGTGMTGSSEGSSMNGEIYIFAESYLEKFISHSEQNNIPYENCNIKLKANDLAGLSYKPLFDYFKDTKNAFRVFIADYVTEEDGTGVVHTAPGFGEEDFYLCQSYDIPVICPIDNSGKFTAEVSDLAGVHVFDTNDTVIKKLKEQGNWFKTEQYIHNYPHCWRTDTPLIYRTMPSWYVAVTKFKSRMVELNKRVNWIPNHIRDGQFGKWLEGAHDWSISRNRFWGTPIPVWKSDDARPNPDDPTGKSVMRRVPDVFDCWFESGSMPFAQIHYPFENKEWFESADFITEYIAQTRGWFYTLFVLSTALFDREPFKNCICHGVVLDVKGQKLSKRLNNYADPMEVFDRYGSDALRFLMLSGSIVCGGNLLLDKEGNSIRDVLKNVIKPIWNSYHFFTMYANADGIKAEVCKDYQSNIDRYMISKCFEAVESIQASMNSYSSQEACKILIDFFEVLNNWYIRRSRERFWKGDLDQDKTDAYNVLYTVFYYILRAAAPLLPLITENIWQGLKYEETSVHLANFPQLEKFDSQLIATMDLVREICNSALSIRNTFNIRIRQPLSSMTIYHQSSCSFLEGEPLSVISEFSPVIQVADTGIQCAADSNEYQEMIKDEVNVKSLELVNRLEGIASLELKLNFPLLGKRIPDKIKKIVQYVKEGKWKQVENEQIFLGDESENYNIEKGEYELLLKANSEYSSVFDNNKGIVILNTELNDELILEGLARDAVRLIQETRKQADFHVSNRIRVIIKTEDEKIKEAINTWSEYIKDIKYCAVSVHPLMSFQRVTLESISGSQCLGTGMTGSSEGSSMNGEIYIFAESYLEKFISHSEQNNIPYENCNIKLKANDLAGLSYKPLFDYFKDTKNAFRVFIADYVTEEDGTGVVHTAPGFGEEDFYLCQSYDIPVICPIDNSGKFTAEVSDLAGVHVFDTNDTVIKKLKEQGNWFKTEQYIHNYPHCWRTDTPLIYRTMPSWYVAVTKFKSRMVELNKRVNWIPNHIRDGQFGKWLEGAHDWSISRNRFWGTPIPVWKSDDARPNPDDPTGKSVMRRVPDVFDCWFESGSMPFAQIHYPFENKEWFESADFITEYIAQTRGWFYTLFVLSTALFDREPFKNCICHGVVLDVKGQKLSKRLNNYADPMEVFDRYGSDALRFLMLSGSIVCGGNLLLDKEGNSIRDVLKNVIKPIWNSYHFFTMYANADGIKAEVCKDYQSTIDRYMISKCFEAVESIQASMNSYSSQEACKILIDFFEVLNNWYIRRSRERFWKGDLDQDKTDAYNVLYTVFYYILRAAAPLLPLITENIWQGLKYEETSVHLANFPQLEKFDSQLIAKMDIVREICNSALSIRNTFNIRIRQPLSSMTIYHQSSCSFLEGEPLSVISEFSPVIQVADTGIQCAADSNEYQEMIKDEVNVKSLELVNRLEGIASLELKLNFPLLGKRIPDKIKKIVQYVKEGKWKQVENEQIFLGDESENYNIEKGEYELLLKANSEYSSVFDNNKGIVILNTELNDELILEGLARDAVRLIQETRKQADFHVSNRIRVIIKTEDEKIKEAINTWSEYIKEQTLALSLEVNIEIGINFYSKEYQDSTVGIKLDC